jgi:uncharacterized membrane protein
MNAAHLHVILNHIPIVGVPIGLALLLYGLLRRSTEVKRAALVVFIAMGLIAVPTFLAGKAAEDIVEHLPGVTEAAIENHEAAGTIAFGLTTTLGALALGALVWSFRTSAVGGAVAALLLLASGGVSGWLAWTGNLGGKVRHTEFREGGFNQAEAEEEREGDREDGEGRGRGRRGRDR